MGKPIIAITMGDAAGIGPEIVVKVLSQGEAGKICRPLLVADPDVMRDIARVVDADIEFRLMKNPSEAEYSPQAVDVICPEGARIDHIQFGTVDPIAGKAAALCLEKAFELAMAGQVDGVVSSPLNKEALHLAGNSYADELAYLADLTGCNEAFMVGKLDFAWAIMVTHHVPFKDVAGLVTKDRVLQHILRMDYTLKRAGIDNARIAVSALNPHKGEGGLFGREEIDHIVPAIKEAQNQGLAVDGPFPGDTIFLTAKNRDYQGIVSMYHDQANIARKIMAKRSGATLFMGLPVPCATPAHGTAFGKAGTGTADPTGLETTLKCTVMLASHER